MTGTQTGKIAAETDSSQVVPHLCLDVVKSYKKNPQKTKTKKRTLRGRLGKRKTLHLFSDHSI